MSVFCTIPDAIKQIKQGKLLIIVDDPSRENQGDLFFPADLVNAKKINLMMQVRGLICVSITREYALRLDLPPMVEPGFNTESTGINFAVSVGAQKVTSFGISASDRAKTIQTIVDPAATPTDLVRPGHVFPLLARDGGVLERDGHTEASSELAELAGFAPCGVICEILTDKGEPAQGAELVDFAKKHDLNIVTIADLISYRQAHRRPELPASTAIIRGATSALPTKYGKFELTIYKSILDNHEHSVLLLDKQPESKKPMLTRVHSMCLTGDTFGSLRCDCQDQLHQSMEMIQAEGRGIIIYLDQEGRGIGLGNKIKAYALQDNGYDTAMANEKLGFPADARSYEVAAQILKDQKIKAINLLTNNPQKEKQLAAQGIHISTTMPLETIPHALNTQYLKTKKQTFGHRLSEV